MNDGNLIPLNARSKSEQRAIQSKGGKASGVSRSFKSSLKRKLKDNPSLIDDVIDVLINEAVEGKNLKAADIWRIFRNRLPYYYQSIIHRRIRRRNGSKLNKSERKYEQKRNVHSKWDE